MSQVAALAPKIEAMEASWNRLRAISGAETPEQVVEYWQGKDASRHWNVQAMFLAMLAECQAGIASILKEQPVPWQCWPAQALPTCSAETRQG